MKEIPLFPLNTVLFPGMPLNLHIFEERYKLMINACIEQREPFGVVLISDNKTDTSPNATPHMIGCTAQITQVQPLREGRMKITAVGKDRFQIMSLEHSKPYLVGMIEPYPLEIDETPGMRQQSRGLRRLVDSYLHLLKDAGQVQFSGPELPESPMSLAYLSAVLLQTPAEQKQTLLESTDAQAMLDNLSTTYRREVVLLEAMLNPPEDNDYRGLYSLS